MKKFLIVLLFLFPSLGFTQEASGYENFHEIDPGRYYRSAQLSGRDFESYIRQYGIRTVINLRGESPSQEWYRQESEVMKRLKIKHINIGMSAAIIPHRENLIALLEAFRTAPRPMLVHCKAGVDRTGEASAIYQMLYMGKSKNEARKMLSLRYGHIRKFKPAKDYFIKDVWQGLDWAYNEYEPCRGQYLYYDIHGPHCRNGL